jgi:hypothetical protein
MKKIQPKQKCNINDVFTVADMQRVSFIETMHISFYFCIDIPFDYK